MPSCAVPTCKNAVGHKKKQDGITYHLFPSDPVRKATWTKIIRKTRLNDSWRPGASSLICSIHFEDKYFYDTKCGLKKLKKEAFPNKVLAMGVAEANTKHRTEVTQKTQKEKFKPFKAKHNVVLIKTESPEKSPETSLPNNDTESQPTGSDSEIGDVDISDSESIFDNPVQTKLKAKLRRREMLCKNHVKQIKILHQNNRRLKKRLLALKSTLKVISAGKLYETSYAEASIHT